ncbi:aminoacyl-tRNA hydrolase [Desulfuromonas sp. AOP6]|uniref:aminoacyl-tRNA hydrolase n=1 Tax=Desulfuromonas sp. AOP6 TaxID=1566351 RepID=UPI001CEDC41E|nr:aminoacyl-tRNA hydrolase [Desulfuromonas sp. AOP6]
MAGLGNPGSKYAGTRHNIGFLVVQKVAERASMSLKKSGHQAIYATGRVAGEEVTLLLPQTYMNLSGASVGSACRSLGAEPGDLIVVHDDIDLPFGALKIKQGGGHGGHNGIRHIRQVLGTGDFVRVKVGVGRPVPGGDVAGYVLSPFSPTERQGLDEVLENAAMAVEAVLEKGTERAMNEFNSRDTRN